MNRLPDLTPWIAGWGVGGSGCATRLTRRDLAPAVGAFGAALFSEVVTAAVPVALADSTVLAALRFAANRVAVPVGVSASVAGLTEGVLMMMLQAKLKTAAYFVVALGILFGVGVVLSTRKSARLWRRAADNAP